jgi:hypothetical protein
MDLKEAVKLAVTMHTKSPKLQAEIIAQDMSYDKMVQKARAIELTKREVTNMKGEETFKVDEMRRALDNVQQGRQGNAFNNNSNYNSGKGEKFQQEIPEFQLEGLRPWAGQ